MTTIIILIIIYLLGGFISYEILKYRYTRNAQKWTIENRNMALFVSILSWIFVFITIIIIILEIVGKGKNNDSDKPSSW